MPSLKDLLFLLSLFLLLAASLVSGDQLQAEVCYCRKHTWTPPANWRRYTYYFNDGPSEMVIERTCTLGLCVGGGWPHWAHNADVCEKNFDTGIEFCYHEHVFAKDRYGINLFWGDVVNKGAHELETICEYICGRWKMPVANPKHGPRSYNRLYNVPDQIVENWDSAVQVKDVLGGNETVVGEVEREGETVEERRGLDFRA